MRKELRAADGPELLARVLPCLKIRVTKTYAE